MQIIAYGRIRVVGESQTAESETECETINI